MNDYRIIPDRPTTNSQSTCNNCHKTIHWNQSVFHRETGRMLPLDEPWTQQREPQRHKCMATYKPKEYIRKYGNDYDNVIDRISHSKELYQFLQKIHWTTVSPLPLF